MSLLSRILLAGYIFGAGYAVAKFTYIDADGYGVFVPHLGGYHVSTLEYEER